MSDTYTLFRWIAIPHGIFHVFVSEGIQELAGLREYRHSSGTTLSHINVIGILIDSDSIRIR